MSKAPTLTPGLQESPWKSRCAWWVAPWGLELWRQGGRLCDFAESTAPFCALVPDSVKWVRWLLFLTHLAEAF